MRNQPEKPLPFLEEELFEKELAVQVKSRLCGMLDKAGFSYQPKYHIFSRKTSQAHQRIQIYTDRNPHGSDTAFASLLPRIHVEMEKLSDMAMQLVEGNRSLLPAHRFIVAMPITSCLGEKRRQDWYINRIEDIRPNMEKVVHAIKTAALPLLSSLGSPEELLSLAGQKDDRLRYDQRMYIFLSTAYLLAGEKEKAVEFAQKRFGVTGSHPRYEVFLRNLSASAHRC